MVVDCLSAELNLSDWAQGKNLVIREILTGMLRHFLAQEKAELEKGLKRVCRFNCWA
ncbi:MAG: hypothetical protein U5L96_00800 [Owenweeksia sp.]|nr:hypothetical protein [Owenweeksia sp.]